jgi:hypothetical protein
MSCEFFAECRPTKSLFGFFRRRYFLVVFVPVFARDEAHSGVYVTIRG